MNVKRLCSQLLYRLAFHFLEGVAYRLREEDDVVKGKKGVLVSREGKKEGGA